MTKKVLIILMCLSGMFSLNSQAQKTIIHDQPDANYRLAVDLFERQQYGAARQLFEEVISQIDDPNNQTRVSALFYLGVSAANLFNPDAEGLLITFVNQQPEHPQQNMARFQLGNVTYRDNRFRDAARWFSMVRVDRLSQDLHDEYHFKYGYSLFMTNQNALARQLFLKIRNPESHYFPPATYYLGHIAYLERSLTAALESLRKLENDPTFGAVVPYYITHIYYLQQDYDRLISFAVPLLENAAPRRAPEIAKMIGDAWFRKGDFARAIPFLENFARQAPQRVSREDIYQLGFAYFRTGRFQEAIRQFEQVVGGRDALAQNAHYHLAGAYLQTDQKRFARNAFLAALQNNHNSEITQSALFNYAKLSYELDLDPFNQAIEFFQRYITEYPNSGRIPEAYGYLVDIFLSTRNYRDALASLEKVPLATPRLRAAFQRITFNRAVELFNNGNMAQAITHFDLSMRHPENRQLNALALYWRGQALFRQGNYAQSIATMERFLTAPGAVGLDVFNRAHYTIGYSFFNQNNFPRAITSLRRFVDQRGENAQLVNDALLRLADSYFMTTQFPLALETYDRAIRQNALDIDYAIFQKGMVQGAMARHNDKITTLRGIIQNRPQSQYFDDALYETGNTWLVLDNSQQALASFNQLFRQRPNSAFEKSALLKTGLIHFNAQRDNEALEMFRTVVTRYPGSQESQEALGVMRNIYVGMDRVDEFLRFTQGLSFANVTIAQQDSLTFMAAEAHYMRGDCENARRSLTGYLTRFPQGIFALNAHFYLAECDFRANNLQSALSGYAFVISRPRSAFSENALLRSGLIETRIGNHGAALEHFRRLEEIADLPANRLEAQIGQIRALFHLQQFRDCLGLATTLAANARATQELQQEAHLLAGKSAMQLNQPVQARNSLRSAMNLLNNEMAAEAMYNLALIEFQLTNFQQTERMIFDFVNRMSAYDYWLAKTFILLADTYLAMGNLFQARHTLQSIIDNYQGPELRAIAIQKLDEISALERSQQQP
jgi:TolA-binding protein